jgi:GxxExxY protein
MDSCMEVHKEVGPGLLESVYVECLKTEFRVRKVQCAVEVPINLVYKGHKLEKALRLDILVENSIIIEIKAVEKLLPVHEAQIISYLKLADKRLGFLVNFNTALLKNGFKRFVNNF